MATQLQKTNFNGSMGYAFDFTLSYDLLSQENGQSNVRYYLNVTSNRQGGYGSGASCPCYINGTYVGGFTSISGFQDIQVGTLDVTYTHDSEGNCTANYSAYCDGVWNGLGDANIEGTFDLPQIEVDPGNDGNDTWIVVGEEEVSYTNVYEGDTVTKVNVDVRIPATEGDVTGYVTLGALDGWTLSENNTKLSKEYTSNTTETIQVSLISFNGTTFAETTSPVYINVNSITTDIKTIATVEYITEKIDGNTVLTGAEIKLKIKDSELSNYRFSSQNLAWIISDDQTEATTHSTINATILETYKLYPVGEADTEATIITETIPVTVEKIGLSMGVPIVSYNEIGEAVTLEVKATVMIPWTFEEKSGYAVLGELEGWTTSDNCMAISKTYEENATETILIPVVSCDGYYYDGLQLEANINIDQILYKKVVKGRCEDTWCLYDVYTKAEIDNLKLKLERILGVDL